MALAMITTLRNSRLDAITSAVGASGRLKIYNGTQPATGGTATTLLADLACSATFAPAASGGVLTLNAITSATAVATSTATWGRFTTSGGTAEVDFTVGTSGTDLVLSSASIVTGGSIAVSSFTITEANA